MVLGIGDVEVGSRIGLLLRHRFDDHPIGEDEAGSRWGTIGIAWIRAAQELRDVLPALRGATGIKADNPIIALVHDEETA
jgi:hypothetical protein